MILILELLFTSLFLNSLDFLYFSNGESFSIGTIYLKVSMATAFEALLSLQSLCRLTSNSFTRIKNFNGCGGNVNVVVEVETLGGALGVSKGSGLKGLSTLKLLLYFDSYVLNIIKE